MGKEPLLYGIIGLLTGGLIAGTVAVNAVNNNHMSMMNMMGMRPAPSMHDESMGMDRMVENLKGKTGDKFDERFLSEMIIHHQGAIDMAALAKQSAKHDEIKQLADDIVAAQTKEISQMQQWQKDWGYQNAPAGEAMHSH